MSEQICVDAPLLEAAQEVFETMIFMELEAAEAGAALDGESMLGTITFTGEVQGCLAISCGVDCARDIARNMLGMDPDDEISEGDVADAIGEVTNMVMGAVKARLGGSAGELNVSIPNVVKGQSLESKSGEDSRRQSALAMLADGGVLEIVFLYKAA